MKVIALVQIYLPYFLPRTPEWSAAPYFQFFYDVEGHLVYVHPRKADERLFPNPIDEQLAQAKFKLESDFIVPVDAPSELIVRDRCFDRIEAQVYGEVESRDDCLGPELAFAYRRLALGACNKFLYRCRVLGRDPDIGGLTWYYSFDDGLCHFTHPHSLTWFDAESKEVLRDEQGREMWTAAGSIRSPLRLPVAFDLIKDSFDARDEPDLTEGLLVSAKELLSADQLREGVINLASACEIASTRYIDRKGRSRDPRVTAIIAAKKQSFAERRFHLVPLYIDGRSLKTEDAAAFSLVEKAYRTRNSLAHSGQLAYKDIVSRKMIDVTRSMANEFFGGCELAVDWINRL
jgi:hypothetical protein